MQTSQIGFDPSPSEEKRDYSENTKKYIENIYYFYLLSEQL